jgi:putative hydrolase of the HAD superfamily
MRNGIEAVAFDLDGTLYPNYRLYVRLLPFILREARLLRAFGKARDTIRAAQETAAPPRYGDFYDYQAQCIAGMLGADPALVKEKVERLIYRGWEAHFKKIKLFPHARETLETLRQAGLKLGLLSDFPPETKLAYLGIAGFWDSALCSEQIGALKPDRRPFDRLAAALSRKPEQILYVGNSRGYDVMGAKRAGMKTALVTGLLSETGADTMSNKNDRSPDFSFHDYRQLCNFVLN